MNIWNSYYSALKPFEEEGKVRLPIIPEYAEHNAHLFYVLFHDEETRDHIMNQLKARGIHSVFHYIPLHSSPLGQKLGNFKNDLPITDDLSCRLLRLPMHAGITCNEWEFIERNLKILFRGNF